MGKPFKGVVNLDITKSVPDWLHPRRQAVALEKPFLLYYCPGACHPPHHAPTEWSDKYHGKFDMLQIHRTTVAAYSSGKKK